MINLAVIIPTFNRKEYLKNLLDQIKNISHSKFTVNVITVVDGSTDGTLEMLKSNHPKVNTVIGNGNWWYTKSINKGIDCAYKLGTDYILTLNDDILLKENFFEELYKAMTQSPKKSIIGASSFTKTKPKKILSLGVKKIILWRYKLIPYYKIFTNKKDVRCLEGLHQSQVLPGRGLLFPIEIAKRINGFDEKFPQYHSDYDFSLRAKKKGYKLYVCWDLIVYSFIEETGQGTSYLKSSFKSFLKGFITKHSRTNLKDNARYLFRHGHKIFFPITFSIFILSSFNSHFFKKKINE
ncbi:glycosyltransferase family 2 protein [Polaribacter marinivivus]|uniref:Glycosyltransferase family 2 protein n=1 Tax=Polaribacter marinivivus TaxID=1524260 RepID=A0ABV8RB86_9FLAO